VLERTDERTDETTKERDCVMDMVYKTLEGLGWITIFGFVAMVALVIETGKHNRRREDDVDVVSDRSRSDGVTGLTDVDFNVVGPVHVEPEAVESNSDQGVVL
jgi:hypothetical protein